MFRGMKCALILREVIYGIGGGGAAGTFRGEIVAHVDLLGDEVGTGGAVEQEANPVGLAHVIGGENAGLAEEGFDKVGVGLEIDNIDVAGTVEAEQAAGNVHNEGEPLVVVIMTKDGVGGLVGPGVILGDAGEVLVDEFFYSGAVHGYIITDG